ncbi:MAG TPA: 50S ribosomal protein L25 [Candidatus Nanoarchaeia archaeon]|nr:50S ribosomal protein L25 [Candidatus Nanoarchaeia archaeon]
MESLKLTAQKRNKSEDVKKMIKSGFIPAVVYGPHLGTNKLVKASVNDLRKIVAAAGESTLIDLIVEGKSEGKVLIKEEQRDPIKDTLIHVDFYEVDMTKEIHAEIPLRFIGESKAVKELAGVLIRSINEIEVKCLPADLVNHIEVDISSLNTFDDVIKIHDLRLPKGIKLIHETDDVVATVAEPKAEEVFETAPAESEQVAQVETGAAEEAEAVGEEKAEGKTEAKK